MTTPIEIRRRTPAGQIRYAAQQLDGVRAQDPAQQTQIAAVCFALRQIADQLDAAFAHRRRAEQAEAAIARVRQYCEALADGSCRVQARETARDVLALLDGRNPARRSRSRHRVSPDPGASGRGTEAPGRAESSAPTGSRARP